MWRKIPLNIKLIVSLLLLHGVFYAIAADILIAWNRTKRLKELQHRLDIQGDFVEDVIEAQGDRLIPNPLSEIRRELDYDRDTYFFVSDASGLIDASSGPPAATIRQLKDQLSRMSQDTNAGLLILVDDGHWLAQIEVVERQLSDRKIQARSHVAIRAQPTLEELENFRQMVIISAVVLMLFVSIATGLIVSYSTRNLRRFAQHLRSHNPLQDAAAFCFQPMSSEEHLLHESYQDMMARVRKNVEAQRLFIAHASHELKSPLATALAVTELALARPRSTAEYQEAHHEVLDVLKVLKRLSMTLLDLSNLEEKSFDSTQGGSCDLKEVLAMVCQRWEAEARAKQIVIAIEPMSSLVVPGRMELWETVFSNLIDNAIKYGKVGGSIRIDSQQLAQGAVVTVNDNGIGIAPHDLARMGEVFFRADASRTSVGSFGLGFAHAKRIVTWLGGSIAIESELGQGTRVRVQIRPDRTKSMP